MFCGVNRGNQPVAVGEACVPNISNRGRRRRATTGGMGLILAAVVFGILLRRHTEPLAFLLILPFAFYGALGVFQAKEKT